MHSNLVEDLNLVLVASAYFGLMNSAINPFVSYNILLYSGKEKISPLILPGNFEYPCSSVCSPPNYLSKGSN
jgi:hypothetical protein